MSNAEQWLAFGVRWCAWRLRGHDTSRMTGNCYVWICGAGGETPAAYPALVGLSPSPASAPDAGDDWADTSRGRRAAVHSASRGALAVPATTWWAASLPRPAKDVYLLHCQDSYRLELGSDNAANYAVPIGAFCYSLWASA